VRYRIQGTLVKTENCAKPCSQASTWVLAWIRTLPNSAVALDFGCGKLRYTIPLAKQLRSVVAVDSSHQIFRRQTINGKYTTVRAYAKRFLGNARVCAVESERWQRTFDIILCANVLSAIPERKVRQQVLRCLAGRLKTNGKMLVCVQFRNSHFEGWKHNSRARRYKDGWLVKNARGTSFYGIIPPESLITACKQANLNVVSGGSHGESAFVIAARQ
jgi:2-polyprenyl-3-methyl-5-hydroxy-6-metoxy-1,4-benzoquinol methylase